MVKISNPFTKNLLNHRYQLAGISDPAEQAWIENEIALVQIAFTVCPWATGNDEHTQEQVGLLAGRMDLERDDRLEMLSILVGFELYHDGSPLPADRDYEPAEDAYLKYPGPSSKDLRITKWMTQVLIDWYETGEGLNVNAALGYTSLSDQRKARAAQRAIERQQKQTQLAAEKEQRRLAREARRLAKAEQQTTGVRPVRKGGDPAVSLPSA